MCKTMWIAIIANKVLLTILHMHSLQNQNRSVHFYAEFNLKKHILADE